MKLYKFLLSALVVTSAFTSCDEIDENERYIELPAAEVQRKVLLEDYTGQMCTNCPDAHRLIASMQAQYPGQVIAVAIHAGSFGILEGSNPKILGLMQPEGNEYATHFGIDAYPSAVINRVGGAIATMTDWSAAVRNEIEKESHLDIELGAEILSDGTLSIAGTLIPSADINGKLQIWVTENGISAMQIDNGKPITDYVHNHVYRTSVTDLWGDAVSLKSGIYKEFAYQITTKENWNKANLHIVAFVYNDKDGVFQVEECKVDYSEEETGE